MATTKHLTIDDFPLSAKQLAKWDGWCLELVDDLLHSHPEGQILYVDNLPFNHKWKYHAALVLDGVVYDAWNPDVRLPPEQYVDVVFDDAWVTWEIMKGEDDA
jgi:hypothetical protein